MFCPRKVKKVVEGLGTGLSVTATNVTPHSCGCGEILPGKFFLITCRVDATCERNEKTFSVSGYIGQHNAMEILAVTWNVLSEVSKALLNDIFAELDGSTGIKNIIIDRLAKSFKSWWMIYDISVDDVSTKITAESTKELCQSGKNQALGRCFLLFPVRILGGEYQLFFDFRSCMNNQLLGL